MCVENVLLCKGNILKVGGFLVLVSIYNGQPLLTIFTRCCALRPLASKLLPLFLPFME